jgi:hypothetical protein
MPNLKPSGMSLDLVYSRKFTDKFKRGTISGKFSVSGVLLPPPPGTMTGKFKITGGTGKLSKAHGSGTMTCSAPSITPGVTCSQVLTKGKL